MSRNPRSFEMRPSHRLCPASEGRAAPRRTASGAAVAGKVKDLAQFRRADVGETDECPPARLKLAGVELSYAMSNALQERWNAAQESVQRISAILKAEPLFAPPSVSISPNKSRPTTGPRGGLAPWQILQVSTFIERHLDTTIRINDVAAFVRLSSSHFSRAFRVSFDDTPRAYLMRRRIARAQKLMLTTNASLGQIAAECGLADQPHLNRLFRRLVGYSPGSWRRARAGLVGFDLRCRRTPEPNCRIASLEMLPAGSRCLT
jgi:AraC family transcriptional regulator